MDFTWLYQVEGCFIQGGSLVFIQEFNHLVTNLVLQLCTLFMRGFCVEDFSSVPLQ